MIEVLDYIISTLQHPFFITIAGLLFWNTLRWSLYRNNPQKKIPFIKDQIDEIVVSLIGSLCFLIFDDEMLVFYYEILREQSDHPIELKLYYYFIVPIVIDRFYWLVSKLQQIKQNE